MGSVISQQQKQAFKKELDELIARGVLPYENDDPEFCFDGPMDYERGYATLLKSAVDGDQDE